MLINVNSVAINGIETVGVTVEVNLYSRGFPGFEIVGLPNKAVAESRERVKAAILNSGLEFPSNKKIVVNLAPADVPKEGSFLDLPIAVGIVSAMEGISISNESIFFGELSLSGNLRYCKGIFLASIYASEYDKKELVIPEAGLNEAYSRNISLVPAKNLGQLEKHLKGEKRICYNGAASVVKRIKGGNKMGEIVGQEFAKRALEISAAGGHNVLMTGFPGTGKTMLAKAYPSLLPPLEEEEMIQVTKIYSASGRIPEGGSIITQRPFRSPHHTTSYAGMIGGGSRPQPGEISLAHRGVLFLDEIAEFPRSVLESLREPIEEGKITISRSSGSVVFPAEFILIAARNPCPCGYFKHLSKQCVCTPRVIQNYRRKISGPLLDRIDLYVTMSQIRPKEISQNIMNKGIKGKSGTSENRVLSARKIQRKRLSKSGMYLNAEMRNDEIKQYCHLNSECKIMLNKAFVKYSLSARAYFKILKVARTIADIDREENIRIEHLAEALQYRQVS